MNRRLFTLRLALGFFGTLFKCSAFAYFNKVANTKINKQKPIYVKVTFLSKNNILNLNELSLKSFWDAHKYDQEHNQEIDRKLKQLGLKGVRVSYHFYKNRYPQCIVKYDSLEKYLVSLSILKKHNLKIHKKNDFTFIIDQKEIKTIDEIIS